MGVYRSRWIISFYLNILECFKQYLYFQRNTDDGNSIQKLTATKKLSRLHSRPYSTTIAHHQMSSNHNLQNIWRANAPTICTGLPFGAGPCPRQHGSNLRSKVQDVQLNMYCASSCPALRWIYILASSTIKFAIHSACDKDFVTSAFLWIMSTRHVTKFTQ